MTPRTFVCVWALILALKFSGSHATRSWQSQCLFGLLCVAMLTSSLGDLSSHLFARNEELDDGPWQQIFDELCPTCNDPDALYDCKSCISRLYFEVAENRFNKNYDVAEEQVEKRNSYINSRRNRNSGCGCCIMSRFSNNFCCNVCHANRNG